MRRMGAGFLAFFALLRAAGAVWGQTLATVPSVGLSGPAREIRIYSPPADGRPQPATAPDLEPVLPETAAPSASACSRVAARAARLEKERKKELRGLAQRQYAVAVEISDSQAAELEQAADSTTVDPQVLRDNHAFEKRLLRDTHRQERAELEVRFSERRGLLAERAAEACPVPPTGQLARAPSAIR